MKISNRHHWLNIAIRMAVLVFVVFASGCEPMMWTPKTVEPRSQTLVRGLDVSSNQGDIDWDEVYSAGYRFAFVRASLGDERPKVLIDSHFLTNIEEAKEAGLLVGAYHYAYASYGNDAVSEARHFLNVAGDYVTEGYLRPVLDFEEGGLEFIEKHGFEQGKVKLSEWIHTWMQTVEEATGVTPILYTYTSFADDYFDLSLKKYDFWNAHVYNCTTDYSPSTLIWGHQWSFWQYSTPENCGINSIPGIPKAPGMPGVDLDVFKGSLTELTDGFVISRDTYPVVLPTVVSKEEAYVTHNSATLHGTITSDGGALIAGRGFYWRPEKDSWWRWMHAAGSSQSEFSMQISNLQPDTAYVFRAYAQNCKGWGYGEALSFRTGKFCSYSLSSSSDSFGSSSGSGSVDVTTSSGCSWIAASNAAWISITSGSSGSGSGTVYYSVSSNSSTSSRSGTITIAGRTFTVSQDGISCSYSISPSSNSFGSSSGSGSVGVTTSSGCSWIAASNAAWISITSGSSGSGSGTVYYSVSYNSGSSSRTGTLTVAGKTFTVSQDGISCSYSISPSSNSFGSSSGSGSVGVTTSSGCSWIAASNAAWISITSGSSGSGSGTVYYSVSSNSSTSSRSGTITIAGRTFTVSQDGISCSYSISPSSNSFGSSSGSGSVGVTTSSGCSWIAASNAAWISITSGSSGSGSGTVYYSVSYNSGSSSRTGTLTVAGKTFTVSQDGISCSYSISPSSNSFGSSSGSGSVGVTTSSGCSWIAASNAAWISITSGSSGSGSGTVYYSVSSNSSTSSRSGTITIAGRTFTVSQDGISCSYSISPSSNSFGSSSGSGSVGVTTSSGCSWIAASNAAWISITSGSSGSGSGTVYYSVSYNSGSSSRTGTLTVAGKTFTVSQDGISCSYSISPSSNSFGSSSGSGSVGVTTSSGCSWIAASNAAWISITSGSSGSGSGTVYYSVSSNSSTSSRSGTITIAGRTFTVSQDGAPQTDTTQPIVLDTAPSDREFFAVSTDTIVATFSEDIRLGSGDVLIIDLDSNVITVDGLAVSGRILTIYPNTTLAYSMGYAVGIGAGAVEDLAGNPNEEYTWAFFTRAAVPEITGVSPATPTAEPVRQLIDMLGGGFVPDSQVTLYIGSSIWVIPPDRTQYIDSRTLRIRVGLTDPGWWSARVTNPDGASSNTYYFYVAQ